MARAPATSIANVAYGMSIDPQTGKRIVNELADRRVYSDAIVANGVPLLQVVDEQNIPRGTSRTTCRRPWMPASRRSSTP